MSLLYTVNKYSYKTLFCHVVSIENAFYGMYVMKTRISTNFKNLNLPETPHTLLVNQF